MRERRLRTKLPWKRTFKNLEERKPDPLAMAQKGYWSFRVMLDSAMQEGSGGWKDGIERPTDYILAEWWSIAFRIVLRKEVRRSKLVRLIGARLLTKGYKREGLQCDTDAPEVAELLKALPSTKGTFKPKGLEEVMAKAKKTKKKKGNKKKKSSSGIDRVRSAVAVERKDYAAKLIVKQNLTDDEIIEKLEGKWPKEPEFKKGRLGLLRRILNSGKRKGFDKPKKPYAKIVAEGKKRVAAEPGKKGKRKKTGKAPSPPKKRKAMHKKKKK